MPPRLIVISQDVFFDDEASILNALFDEGLEILHLRKPSATKNDIATLINKINNQYHHQIVLHNHYDLINDFDILRLHQKSTERNSESRKKIDSQKKIIWSSSFHLEEEIKKYTQYNYGFLSPIFNSISKKNYPSPFNKNWQLDKKNMPFPIIALGGICVKNLPQIAQKNFDSIAILGAIWNNKKNALATFKTINHEWKKYIH